jgi:hypoxanthine phosphoribosyltransferase
MKRLNVKLPRVKLQRVKLQRVKLQRVKLSNYSILFYIVLIILIILIVYLIQRVKTIDAKIKQYPAWIDKSLYPILKKKVDDIPFIYKMCEVLYTRGNYYEWSTVEKMLDSLIDKIKNENIKFDAIVGIKSGGAILTKYIAEKLNIKYYYIKVSDRDYKCKKKPTDIFDFRYKVLMNIKKQFIICEPIEENLQHQNILLFDEIISNGDTMLCAMNYLLNDKKANMVIPATLFSRNNRYDEYKPIYLKKRGYNFNAIWPWGYDN